MDNVQERFACLLKQTLIPDFCSNTTRNVNPTGFCESRTRLFEIDMADFLRGWEAQLLKHKAGGLYRTVNGGAYEQFFWSGRKANVPRTFTLWVEPIITLGVLARMYWDFGWPKTLVDTQSKRDWAFDVLGRKSESDPSLLIACEV